MDDYQLSTSNSNEEDSNTLEYEGNSDKEKTNSKYENIYFFENAAFVLMFAIIILSIVILVASIVNFNSTSGKSLLFILTLIPIWGTYFIVKNNLLWKANVLDTLLEIKDSINNSKNS